MTGPQEIEGFISNRINTNMKKVSFTFPDYDSLWTFKEKAKAINIRIKPRKHLISGLFDTKEIDMAVNDFRAVEHPSETLKKP